MSDVAPNVDFLFSATQRPEVQDGDDETIVRGVWEMLVSGKRFRKIWDMHWDRYWHLWEGVHWNRPKFSILGS